MVCMPIGGMAQMSLAAKIDQLDAVVARSWLTPRDFLLAAGCLAVLSLTHSRRGEIESQT